MLDYSKWDNLQLSDDSDIEVHPNVDKRSFIRAKQNQIHIEREQKRCEVEAIKYDQIINNNLALRISALLSNLKLNPQLDTKDAGSVVFQAVIKTAPPSAEDDQPPPRPKGVFKDEQSPPTYSRMMASLLDEVNKSLDKQAVHPDGRFEALIHELEGHLQKIQDLQKDLSARLDSIEKQTATKITSESYHVGFDRSIISKDKSNEEVSKSSPKVELLNPGFNQGSSLGSASSGAEAPGSGSDDEKNPTASPAAKGFAQIPPLDYRASHVYISTHPEILKESETDALLIEALDAAVAGNSSGTWQLTHQALLLQYCRLLGRDGVGIFFKRMATPDHQAKQLFHQDVKEKVQRLHEIAAKQRADESEGGLEQIQIQAANPGTTIHIRVPEIDANDEEGKKMREIFDQFPREMRDALESGSLDNVNKVLGTMDVSEAEDLVALLGEAGCLDIDQDIIDTTTEEGRRQHSQIQGAAEDELGGGANEVD